MQAPARMATLGAHLIDLAHFLVGEFEEVIGMSETFIKERPLPTSMTGLALKAVKMHRMGQLLSMMPRCSWPVLRMAHWAALRLHALRQGTVVRILLKLMAVKAV